MNYTNGPYPPPHGGGYGPNQGYPPQFVPQPPKNPWLKPVRRNANIACLGLILVIVTGVFMSFILSGITGFLVAGLQLKNPEINSLIMMSLELVTYILMFIIPLGIIRLMIGIPPKVAFPMRRPRASIALPAVMMCLGASVIGSLCYAVIAGVLGAFFHVEPIMPDLPVPVGIPALIVYFLWLAVAPAVLEELMFRGVIMQSLRRFGDMFALVCSAILFSLAHQNLVQGPNAFILGLFIGFFTLRSGSLKTAMLMHFVNNAFAITVELLTQNMSLEQQGLVSLSLFAFYIVAGILGLIFLVSMHSGIFHLKPSDYPLSAGKKSAAFFLNVFPIIYIIGIAIITAFQFQSVGWY